MTSFRSNFLPAVAAAFVIGSSASAHDTWVEVNTSEVREGNVVYVDLKLGNHGNDHRAIKSAKAYFVVGPDAAATKGPLSKSNVPLGHPLELVPLTNPVTESGPNKPIRVRVVFEEKPLANARVAFIPRGQQLTEGFDETFERHTDDKGVTEFTPSEANLILVVVHHQEPERSGEGYDSTNYSATLTVAVPEVPFPIPVATKTAVKKTPVQKFQCSTVSCRRTLISFNR